VPDRRLRVVDGPIDLTHGIPSNITSRAVAAVRRNLPAGMSARGIQRNNHVTWRTAEAAAESAWPAARAAYPERGWKLDPFKPLIEEC
jgi:hypothetical protein